MEGENHAVACDDNDDLLSKWKYWWVPSLSSNSTYCEVLRNKVVNTCLKEEITKRNSRGLRTLSAEMLDTTVWSQIRPKVFCLLKPGTEIPKPLASTVLCWTAVTKYYIFELNLMKLKHLPLEILGSGDYLLIHFFIYLLQALSKRNDSYGIWLKRRACNDS